MENKRGSQQEETQRNDCSDFYQHVKQCQYRSVSIVSSCLSEVGVAVRQHGDISVAETIGVGILQGSFLTPRPGRRILIRQRCQSRMVLVHVAFGVRRGRHQRSTMCINPPEPQLVPCNLATTHWI